VAKSSVPYWLLTMGVVALITAACTLNRSDGANGNIAAFEPPSIAQEQVTTVLRLEPEAQQLNVNDNATVQIWVDDVINLFGFDLTLEFNPTILQVQDADPGQDGVQIQPGNLLSADIVVRNLADNETGSISYIISQQAPSPAITGTGVLATINFTAVAGGNSDLIFTMAELSDTNGQPIPADQQSGQIIVSQPGGSPTATGTPTLTLTPTETPMGETPTPTMTLTATATITASPAPTDTPTPTLTPAATQMPVPPPTPTSPPPPLVKIPPGATTGFCYFVTPGDSMGDVVRKIGETQGIDVNPVNIAIANALPTASNRFLVRQRVLYIPAQMGRGPNVYQIQAGDTLQSIADECHLPLRFLTKANRIDADTVVQAGQRLIIPIPPFPPPSRFPYPPQVFPPPYNNNCCP
jgi:hypothetical protein